ncbi:unnamed protein product [Oppiella nova]|uniref:Legumain prodomain domain-containing protein n=1 Tax=Oppiella nova TaxID=334625 RepID=A0A7R9LAR4_9ACAR|nr:unnamed protein product [Oppiella nova]CAG2161671.1 unnamed protein product [Oppiella nova]
MLAFDSSRYFRKLPIAGAKGWGDYASQSSVYHAYQVVHANGIPDENIIVFHPDDIAYNPNNPVPGTIIDRPNGTDVYHGVPKDYVGKEVNPNTFLEVLRGSEKLATNGKKVLNSGPDDHVFIYFLDHGAPDVILFQSEYLYAEELNTALKDMHRDQRYGKLVFYLEACESGSMFDKLLPNNINIYAISSSKPTQNSGKMFDDKKYKTMIGYNKKSNKIQTDPDIDMLKDWDVVDNREAPVYVLRNLIENSDDLVEKQKYTEELETILKGREYVDNVFNEYVNSIQHLMPNIATNAILHTKQELNNRHCYRQLVDTFHQNCFNLNQNPYVLSKLQIFVNICEQMLDSSDADIAVNRLIQHCDRNGYKNDQQVEPG